MFIVYEMRRSSKDIPETQIECIPFDEKFLLQYKELYNAAFRPMREALGIEPYDWYGDDNAILSRASEIYILTEGDLSADCFPRREAESSCLDAAGRSFYGL